MGQIILIFQRVGLREAAAVGMTEQADFPQNQTLSNGFNVFDHVFDGVARGIVELLGFSGAALVDKDQAGVTRGIGVASSVEAGAAGACAAVAAVAESFAVCARNAGGQIEKHRSTAVPMSRFNLTINLLGMGKRKSAFSPAQLASQNFVVGQPRRGG